MIAGAIAAEDSAASTDLSNWLVDDLYFADSAGQFLEHIDAEFGWPDGGVTRNEASGCVSA